MASAPLRTAGAAHSPAAQPWIRLKDVGVQHGKVQALREVSLAIHPGERVALVGANGSGKSSLLRVLHGLNRASTGSVERPLPLREAMLFQRPHMLRASALSNIALGLWLRGVRWGAARQQAQAALQRVGLQAVAAQNARTLSGGQQQRLALARAWVLRPQVLLLDEPTASLDPHAKREVEALMAEFAHGPEAVGDRGAVHAVATPPAQPLEPPMTMVFSSHNLGQVKRLASRVLYLEHGRVLTDLPVHAFFNGPLPPATQLFVKGEMV